LRRLASAIGPWIPDPIYRVYAKAKSLVLPFRTRQALERIAKDPRPILVGPWLSEVGFEVLYWLPFLAWFQRAYHIAPGRITVVSRGGAGCWYADIGTGYVDILRLFSKEDFRAMNAARIAHFRSQKHVGMSGFDQEILARAKVAAGLDDFILLHPGLMYRLLGPAWSQARGLEYVSQFSEYRMLPQIADSSITERLPADYVAVKLYFSDCLPDTPSNREYLEQLLERLARFHPVVLLDTGLVLDDHRDFSFAGSQRIVSVKHLLQAETNLQVQSQVVSRARAFVGTYGGFSYLAPFYGVPSVAVYSEPNFVPTHLAIARHVFSQKAFGQFEVTSTAHLNPGIFDFDWGSPHDSPVL